MNAELMKTADSILYISALLADQPRAIDQVIDYFGGGVASTGHVEPARRRSPNR